jgi:hypothetical protein
MRRGFRVRPMSGRDAETADAMNVEAALRAVEGEILELALEVGLHPEEFEPEHLRMDGDRMITSTGSLRFVHELVGLDGLLGDVVDSVLEDVALAACHCEMLARGSVDRWGKPRNGLPQRGSLGPGLQGRGGPVTIVWRLVSQRNQRIDRPPFDLVTPPQSSRDG